MNMKEKLIALAADDSFARVIIESDTAQKAIDRAQVALSERKGSVSGWLFDVARDECVTAKDFVNRCKLAEDKYKAVRTGAKLPKQYSQAKSNIKAAMEFGVVLKDHATESAMRKALIEARKAKAAKAAAAKAGEKHTAICARLLAALEQLKDNGADLEIALLEVNETVMAVESLVADKQEPVKKAA